MRPASRLGTQAHARRRRPCVFDKFHREISHVHPRAVPIIGVVTVIATNPTGIVKMQLKNLADSVRREALTKALAPVIPPGRIAPSSRSLCSAGTAMYFASLVTY